MPVVKTSFPLDESNTPAEGITQYILTNSTETITVKLINYGCIITNILVKSKSGDIKDIVLGFDNLKGYKSKDNAYFGAICGRVANRIRCGRFSLNDKVYQLNQNASDGETHLHGGLIGFDQKIWKEVSVDDHSVTLSYVSPDAEEKYPGSLEVTVKYSLRNDTDLGMEYMARLTPGSKDDTILNLTNHTYFNLSGCSDSGSAKVLDHRMRLEKDSGIIAILDKDSSMVPNGKIITLSSPEGAPFDFYPRKSDGYIFTLGDRIREAAEYGYDHSFIFGEDKAKWRENVLRVWSPKTDIILSVSTTEPTVHLYTGHYLSTSLKSKKTQGNGQIALGPETAFCLETQRYPDAINHEGWRHQVILKPNQEYRQKTVYHIFSM